MQNPKFSKVYKNCCCLIEILLVEELSRSKEKAWNPWGKEDLPISYVHCPLIF